MTDDRDPRYAGTVTGRIRRDASATGNAIPNETRKLGTVTGMLHDGGSRWPTALTHHDGPVG